MNTCRSKDKSHPEQTQADDEWGSCCALGVLWAVTDLPGADLNGVSQGADEAGILRVRDAELSEAMQPLLRHGRAVLALRSEVNVRHNTGQELLLSHRPGAAALSQDPTQARGHCSLTGHNRTTGLTVKGPR